MHSTVYEPSLHYGAGGGGVYAWQAEIHLFKKM